MAVTLVLSVLALVPALSAARAAERVVVSVPALHSLVETLLDGVDHVGLLYPQAADLAAPGLSPQARQQVEGADLVVWVGGGHEGSLASHRLSHPEVANKTLTLSDTMPLLSDHLPGHATGARDMKFWLDPRLAKVAVGRLAPALVSLYPDQVELILDNEIALKKRLGQMEAAMQQALGNPNRDTPLAMDESDVLYLAWRFNLKSPNCPAAAARLGGFDETPGAALYFVMMDRILDNLRGCQGEVRTVALTN